MAIQLRLTQCYKMLGFRQKDILGHDGWYKFDETVKMFPNMSEAKKWIKETYGKCKSAKMYIDVEGRDESIHCGYIRSWKEPTERCYRQDWIEFREVKVIDLDNYEGAKEKAKTQAAPQQQARNETNE